MDLANREIIAYNFATRPKFSLVKKMLEQGLSRIKPTECPIIHSDQGVLYGSVEWVKMLEGKAVQRIEPSAIPSSIFKLTNLSNFWDRSNLTGFFVFISNYFSQYISDIACKCLYM